MIVRVVLLIDTSGLDERRESIGTAAERMHEAVRAYVLPALQPYIDATLNKPAPARKGTFVFATLKSQRFFFATHEGAYQRTGKVLAWAAELEVDGKSGAILAVNPIPYTKYVFGSPVQRQVVGHQLTGWPLAEVKILEVVGPAKRLVIGAWVDVNQFKGKFRSVA